MTTQDGGERPGEGRSGFVPGTLAAAIGLVGLEALALVVAAVVVVVKTVAGRPADLAGSLLIAVFALGGAALLVVGARGLRALNAGSRTPVLVVQLLALPVAFSLWIQAGVTLYGAPIMVVALVTIFLLFAPPTRAVLDPRE